VVVAGGDHDAAAGEQGVRGLLQPVAEAVVERLVHLVQQDQVRIELGGGGEPQPGAHPLRVGRSGAVEGLLEPAALPDVVQPQLRIGARGAPEHGEQQRVLPSGQRGQQPRVDREHRGDPALHQQLAAVGGKHAGDRPQQGRLAGAGGPDQRNALARPHGGVHLA
jgi:hypothetical protein